MKLSQAQRKMVAEVFVGLAMCGAAYYFLVQPLRKELMDVRAQVSAALAKAPITTPPDPAKVAALMENVKAKADRVQAAGEIARNESAMFARVSDLASSFNVRIEELRPSNKATQAAFVPLGVATPSPGATPPAGGAIALAPATPKDSSVSYEFAARGTYPDITAFITALGSELGYTVVRGVRMNTGGGDGKSSILVNIKTEHFNIDVSAALALTSAPAELPTGPAANGMLPGIHRPGMPALPGRGATP